MDYITYSEGKCSIAELHIQQSRFLRTHYYQSAMGKDHVSFGFLTKGKALMVYAGKQVYVPEGTLFYLPNWLRYRSVYSGSPDIEFYGLHLFSRATEHTTGSLYALQTLPAFSNQETLDTFHAIWRLLGQGGEAEQWEAIGLFCQFYAKVLPCLQTEQRVDYPMGLLKALDYLEANFTRQVSLEETAKHCFLSQSRLYAMFHDVLRTTPVRYLNELRTEKAADLLCQSRLSVAEIAREIGFSSETYFREVFRQYMGVSPSEYRSRMRGSAVTAET